MKSSKTQKILSPQQYMKELALLMTHHCVLKPLPDALPMLNVLLSQKMCQTKFTRS
jgi:hypothetical protein